MKIKVKEIRGQKYSMMVYEEEEKANIHEGIIYVSYDDPNYHYFKRFDPYREGRAYIPRIIIFMEKDNTITVRDTLFNVFKKLDKEVSK